MNCKPEQMAWISVPAKFTGTGMEQIHGHIVRTVRLQPNMCEVCWVVTPPQRVVITRYALDAEGRRLAPGEKLEADGIPDAWLRPFDPQSEPQPDAVTVCRELETT